MAATTQFTVLKPTKNPLAFWHLLSLDAPTVAALWTWFIARACHLHLPLASPAAMTLAVWLLYAADRLLDTRFLDTQPLDEGRRIHSHPPDLEARHFFHHRYRRAFLVGMVFAAIALAILLPTLNHTAIGLYFIEGAMLFVWFLVLHASHSAHRLPKEIAVGLFFAAATFIPTIAREPFAGSAAQRLALLPAAILFAAVCSLNCLFIYAWEHEPSPRKGGPQPHPTTRLALRHLSALSLTTAITGAALALFHAAAPSPIPTACVLSALLLLALDRNRRHLSVETLRATADLALLTPLVLLPFLRS